MKRPALARHAAAFTLAELLAVILLLSVLVGLLVPVLGRLKTTADSTRCLNNLRHTGMALTLHIASSGGRFTSLYGGGYSEKTWSKILFETDRLGDKAVFRCPSGKTSYELTSKTWDWQGYGLNLLTPPGITTTVVNSSGKSDKVYELKTSSINEHHKHILLADSSDGSDDEFQSFRIFSSPGTPGILLRHHKKANIYFLDGHIEALDRAAIAKIESRARIHDLIEPQ